LRAGPAVRRPGRVRIRASLAACLALVISGAAVAGCSSKAPDPPHKIHTTRSVPYLGIYEHDSPGSYAGVDGFAQSIGRRPNLVTYYSAWPEPFDAGFAAAAAKRGATVLVQMDATNISLADIASGQYDDYLRTFAAAVKAFGNQVVLSFGHEMNGNWYTWGYQHTPAPLFVAAWRHIVTLFRTQGAPNVTWMWTVNIIDTADNHIPDPGPWWPGASYVNWVGIDGYYYDSSWTFASLFGPTIVSVRELTRDPILISETGASATAGQPAKITDLFAGVAEYRLLGFVWYDAIDPHYPTLNWRITSPAAFGAYGRGAKMYVQPPAAAGTSAHGTTPP
jgi:hypothetical protein